MKILDTINNVWGLVAIGAVFAAGYINLLYQIDAQYKHLNQYTETATTYWDTTIRTFENDVDDLKRLMNEVRQETIDNRNRSLAAQDVVKQNTQAIMQVSDTLQQLTIVMTRIEERLK